MLCIAGNRSNLLARHDDAILGAGWCAAGPTSAAAFETTARASSARPVSIYRKPSMVYIYRIFVSIPGDGISNEPKGWARKKESGRRRSDNKISFFRNSWQLQRAVQMLVLRAGFRS